MKSTADIVIIGGGVHGASLAFHLAKAKAGEVVLLEKKHLASGPTGKSGAMIRPLFVESTYVELVIAATRIFENWDDEIGGDPGFVQKGFLRITNSLDPEIIDGDLELTKRFGEPYEILSKDQLSSLVPTADFEDDEIGLLIPKGGFADPVATTVALARAAQRHGADILEGVQVTGIEVKKGRVQTVLTDHGNIATPIVVNCGGSWSDRIAKMVGIELPIQTHRTSTGLFRWPEEMKPGGPILSDGVNRVYLRTMGDSMLRAAHFGCARDPADPDTYDETVTMEQIDVLRNGVRARYDAMRRTVSYGGFSALYDMTPDGHPIVDKMQEVEGFWCNCGWSGNGFAGSPVVGRCLARMIMGQASEIDLSLFLWPRGDQVKTRPFLKWIHQ